MSKRVRWLDFARGISILFVVCGHSLGSIYNTKHIDSNYFTIMMSLLFTIMMPCFFAISGYLYKSTYTIHSYLKMIYKKLISLGIPYVIFSIIYVILQNVGGNNINNFHSYNSLFWIFITPISYLWFLYALFFMFIIIGMFDLLKISHFVQFFFCFILMTISILFPHLLYLGIFWTFNNIIYFYFGYLLSSNNISNKILNNINLKKILCTLMIFFLFLGFQSFFIIGGSTDDSTFSDFITKLISIILLIEISMNIPQDKCFRYFEKYGRITLIIYLIHGPVISIARIIAFKFINITSINVIVLSIFIAILAWYFSIFICYLAKRITIINFVFYPRKNYISKLILNTTWGKWLLGYKS